MTEAWSPGRTVRPSAAGDTRVSATYLPDGENGLESKKRWMVDWFGGVMIHVGTDGLQLDLAEISDGQSFSESFEQNAKFNKIIEQETVIN